jgi:hypothetical protein
MMGKRVAAWVLALTLSACASGHDLVASPKAAGYPLADGPGEVIQPDEARAATAIGDAIEVGLTRRAKARGNSGNPGDFARQRPFIRDAHPKAHGCVKANFRILSKLPKELAKGVFKPGEQYCAWVRYSNSNEDPNRSDARSDGRGMAIKLLGVQGETLVGEHKNAGTQDFIMISDPVFFINDARDYATVVREQNKEDGPSILRLLAAIGLKGAMNAAAITSLYNRNPFEAQYWSMVPYQLGIGKDAKAVKFKSQPCGYDELSATDKAFYRDPDIPADSPPNFLRETLRTTLDAGSPCMEFLVQVRTPSMSVEDSMTEWSPKAAPFQKVATLYFPAPQNFDTPAQNLACEDMSYTPWHALEEHKPLGALNRIRKVVYQRISAFRRQNNNAPREEPPSFQLDQCKDGRWLAKGAG